MEMFGEEGGLTAPLEHVTLRGTERPRGQRRVKHGGSDHQIKISFKGEEKGN